MNRTVRNVFLATLATLAAVALSGCVNIKPELVSAMAGDNAHIRARVTSLYGTIEFERVMDFPPPAAPAPPAVGAESQEAPAPQRRGVKVKRKPVSDALAP